MGADFGTRLGYKMPLGIHNPTHSLKPRLGRSFKRARRIEIVARLESLFISDADIANHLGLTVQAIHAIKATPEFLAKRITLQTGMLSNYDKALVTTEEDARAELADMVPMALQAMKTIIMDRSHPAHAKMIAELLDRNKATSKITKMEHSLTPKIDTAKQDQQGRELLALLEGKGDDPGTEAVVYDKSPSITQLPSPELVEDAESQETDVDPLEILEEATIENLGI